MITPSSRHGDGRRRDHTTTTTRTATSIGSICRSRVRHLHSIPIIRTGTTGIHNGDVLQQLHQSLVLFLFERMNGCCNNILCDGVMISFNSTRIHVPTSSTGTGTFGRMTFWMILMFLIIPMKKIIRSSGFGQGNSVVHILFPFRSDVLTVSQFFDRNITNNDPGVVQRLSLSLPGLFREI